MHLPAIALAALTSPLLLGCPRAVQPPCRAATLDADRAIEAVLASPAYQPLRDAGFTVRERERRACKVGGSGDVVNVHLAFASPASASAAGIEYQDALDFAVDDTTGAVLEPETYRGLAEAAAAVPAGPGARMEQDAAVAAWLARHGTPASAEVERDGLPASVCIEYEGAAHDGGAPAITFCDGDGLGVVELTAERLADAGAEGVGLDTAVAAAAPAGCEPHWIRLRRDRSGNRAVAWTASGTFTGEGCPLSWSGSRVPGGAWTVEVTQRW